MFSDLINFLSILIPRERWIFLAMVAILILEWEEEFPDLCTVIWDSGGLALSMLSASPSHICNISENDDDPSLIASDSTQ